MTQTIETAVRGEASTVLDSHFGKVQIIAFAMAAMQQQQKPLAEQWPVLRPYFEGLERGTFPTLSQVWIKSFAAELERIGIDSATAIQVAIHEFHQPHGAVLQFLAARARALVDERRAFGDAQAATLVKLVFVRLLKQLTLDVNEPAHVRLVAADLLAAFLRGEPTEIVPADVPGGLDAWHAAYRAGAKRFPPGVLGLDGGLEVEPQASAAFLAALGRATWSSTVLVIVGGAALALVWVVLGCGLSTLRRGPCLVSGALIVAGALGAMAILVNASAAGEDVRRSTLDPADARGVTLHSLAAQQQVRWAGGAALGLLAAGGVAAALLKTVDAGRIARVAGAWTVAWLGLAAVALVCSILAESARRDYERRVGAVLRGDVIAYVAGAEADRRLDALRGYEP